MNHSAVAVQELLHTVGVLDPDDLRSAAAVQAIEHAVNGMPPHRLFTPDLEILAGAAVYAGILCRVQGYAKDNRMQALHDCILFLQAIKLDLTILTRNIRDFDYLLQMRPDGRALFYHTAASDRR